MQKPGFSVLVEIEALEKSLGDLTDRMSISVAFKCSKDSREYEMVGGVHKSDEFAAAVPVACKLAQKTLLVILKL